MKRLFIAWLTGRRRIKAWRNKPGWKAFHGKLLLDEKEFYSLKIVSLRVEEDLAEKDEEITKLKLILRSIAMDDSTNELIKAMEK